MLTVKLVPFTLAVTRGAPNTSWDWVLQVTPRMVPMLESSVTEI